MTDSANYNVNSPAAPPAPPPGGEPAVRIFVRTKGGRVQSIKDHDIPFPVVTPVELTASLSVQPTVEVADPGLSIAVADPNLTVEVAAGPQVFVDDPGLTYDVQPELSC